MDVPNNVSVVRNVKDTVFRSLFSSSKENALSLYNAVNKSSYTNAEELEFTTLEDAIYMGMKNDNSFLFQGVMNLYEHQSSFNPNMPLRGLMYAAKLYEIRFAGNKRIYGKSLVKIPTPKYLVFFNGLESDMPNDRIDLKLSDAFEVEDNSGAYEWTATMININAGHNKDLMDSCKLLSDYSTFISLIKTYRETMPFEMAVEQAITVCLSKGILSDFLIKMQEEVKSMLLTEFDQKAYEEFIKDESFEEGRENGLAEGKRTSLLRVLSRMGDVPKKLESVINEENDIAVLDSWFEAALDSKNLEGFSEKIMITSN